MNISIGKIAGSAAILKEGKILLLKRSLNSKLYPNHWTFPSGGVEESDLSIKDTVMREVKEETNLEFTPKEKLGFYETVIDEKRYFALVHLGSWTGEISLQPEEVSEYKFFSFQETEKLELAFAYREVLNDLHKRGLLL